jgi:hypothetical protein
MSVAVEVAYGFVWCPSCEKIERRKKDSEPLPLCKKCEVWTEPLLCDYLDCEDEATIMLDDAELNSAEYRCEEHA